MSSKRTLTIKTGVVERTVKELVSYQKEVEDNMKQVEQVRAGTDHSKLKQWENVLSETQSMIPDTKSRLSTAAEELKAFIQNSLDDDDNESVQLSEELKRAKTALSSATQALEQ